MGLKKPAIGGTPSASGVLTGEGGYLYLPPLSFKPTIVVAIEKHNTVKDEKNTISFVFIANKKIMKKDAWGSNDYSDYFSISDYESVSLRTAFYKGNIMYFASGSNLTGRQFEWFAYGE